MPPAPPEPARTPRQQFVRLLDRFHDYLLAEKENGNDTVTASAALATSLAAPLPKAGNPPRRQPASVSPRTEVYFVLGAPLKPDADDLLTRMIAAMGFNRSDADVAVGPADQMGECKPRVIVALGPDAVKQLPGAGSEAAARGAWGECQGMPLMITHNPADLVDSVKLKKEAWADLQAVMAKLGKKPPGRK